MARLLHLTIRNNSGSIEHFYHFVLGYLLPLGSYMTRERISQDRVMLLCSCGPFDRLMQELALPGLILCERQTHAKSKAMILRLADADVDEIRGLDSGQLLEDQVVYDVAGVRAGIAFVRQRLALAIAEARRAIEADWVASPRIVLIERGEPDPFYASPICNDVNPIYRTAGKQRRMIGNHAALAIELAGAYRGLRNVMLEGMPLAAQIALFECADVVIAQHGAALANVIWMRPDAGVIEIDPNTGSFVFTHLARLSGLHYQRIGQPGGDFGDVAIDEVVATVARMVA
jgi:hypothetical protein